jgi:HKD family nuclease
MTREGGPVQVETVTTSDGSLLRAVRSTLADAAEVFLCVAFVHERGLHLIERELEALQRRRVRARLLMTTHFGMGAPTAVGRARRLGLEVRVLNPGPGQTFHPKLYLADGSAHARAVIGSANLTAGLATNVEVAVALRGTRTDPPLADAWSWAERLWRDERTSLATALVAEPAAEPFETTLFALLASEVRRDPLFVTLGPTPRPNRVVDLTRLEVYVETERSRATAGRAEPIPAWMFNIAWDRLRTHGTLSNRQLLEDLRVHRSSAVCAMLARLPNVDRLPGREIVLAWRDAASTDASTPGARAPLRSD